MKLHLPSLICLLGLLLFLAGCPFGCQGKRSRAPDGILIELSEPEAVFEKMQMQRLPFVKWQVKYRFSTGRPEPLDSYGCSVTKEGLPTMFDEASVEWTSGKDMKAQGVFTGSKHFPRVVFSNGDGVTHEGKEPESLTLVVWQKKTKGGAYQISKVSNEIVCNIKKP